MYVYSSLNINAQEWNNISDSALHRIPFNDCYVNMYNMESEQYMGTMYDRTSAPTLCPWISFIPSYGVCTSFMVFFFNHVIYDS